MRPEAVFTWGRHARFIARWDAIGFYSKAPRRRPCALAPAARFAGSQAASGHGKCGAAILVARQPFGGFLFGSGQKAQKSGPVGWSALTLCPAKNGTASGAWLANGSLIYYDDTKLMRVPATGGEPKPLFGPDVPAPKMAQLWPRALPDGRHILFLALGPQEKEGIYAADLESGQARMVIPVRSLFEYSPDGYILYSRQQAIMAQRFDARSLTIQGDPLPVVDRAGAFSSAWGPVASASENGTLVYSRPVNRAAQLHWYSRDGKKLSSIAGARNYSQLLISPDGRRVAVELDGTEKTPNRTLWLLELSTGILSLFTPNTDARYSDAVWSSDSRDLIYSRFQGFKPVILRKPAGGGAEQVVISPETALYPEESLPDGSILALSQNGKDIVRIPPSGRQAGKYLPYRFRIRRAPRFARRAMDRLRV